MFRRASIGVLALLAVLGLGVFTRARLAAPKAGPAPQAARRPPVLSSLDAPPPAVPERARLLIVGGGAEPASGGVQLEQDVALAIRSLAGPGVVLFGGGRSVFSVREDGDEARFASSLAARLATIFDPRDRSTHYRPTRLRPDAPATPRVFLATLERMLMQPGEPVVVFVATHGEEGPTPRETSLVLWGGGAITPANLFEIETKPGVQRGSRLVLTSCHGGGFGEIATLGSSDGGLEAEHCGLFATTWDRVASGCDTNPERSAQEGYAIHFFAALRGRDREGRALPRDEIDLDRDGRIALLEAHTYVRGHSHSYDVPTTTSEHYLRANGGADARSRSNDAFGDPFEDEVIRVLGSALGTRDRASTEALRVRLVAAVTSADEALAESEAARDEALADVRIELLERYPTLDDAWHPSTAALLETKRTEVEALLARSSHLRDYEEWSGRVNALAEALDREEIALARVERLVAAYETKALEANVRRRDPAAFARFESLRRCEEYVPALEPEPSSAR